MMVFAELHIVKFVFDVDNISGGRNYACSRLVYGIRSLCGDY
jgi:hypothetical protein